MPLVHYFRSELRDFAQEEIFTSPAFDYYNRSFVDGLTYQMSEVVEVCPKENAAPRMARSQCNLIRGIVSAIAFGIDLSAGNLAIQPQFAPQICERPGDKRRRTRKYGQYVRCSAPIPGQKTRELLNNRAGIGLEAVINGCHQALSQDFFCQRCEFRQHSLLLRQFQMPGY